MAILTKPLSLNKDGESEFTLNTVELASLPIVQANNYYKQTNKWSKVTLNYISSLLKEQVVTIIFDANEVTPSVSTMIDHQFIGELILNSIIINDKADGAFTIRRDQLNAEEFDVPVTRFIAPASEIIASANLASVSVGPEATQWKVGWKVRLYDAITEEYIGLPNTINAINGQLLAMSTPFSTHTELILVSPNKTRYEVTVTPNGELSTEQTIKTATKRFKILARKVNPTDPDSFGELIVSNDGTLALNMSSVQMKLPTSSSTTLKASDDSLWLIAITPDGKIATDSGATSIVGKYVRFAYPDEVVLEQLRDYAYNY